MTILIWDKSDFEIKIVTTYKEVHFIMLKGSVYQEDITIISLYAPSNRLKLYKVKIDRMKRELALKKINVISITKQWNRTTRSKFSNEIEALKDTINQPD